MNVGREFLKMRSLDAPEGFPDVLCGHYPKVLRGLVYDLASGSSEDLPWALDALDGAATPAPLELIPFMPVDDRSFACMVCRYVDGSQPSDFGKVVRWHLDPIPDWAQRQVLDLDIQEYLATVAEDLAAREQGLERIGKIIEKYHASHGSSGTRPRHYHERPIRIAVQNVIIGQAAIRHDDTFNGLTARVWQTCQVPHVATHEGSRALAALTLGEAFRSGGTMEIRFDKHPERKVPAVLRQYARTRGIHLGKHDEQSISPSEARELMWAVTEMPAQLRSRLQRLTDEGQLTPERACFVLLSGIWLPIEVDFLAATSSRLPAILRGGADTRRRPARQAELAVCRASHMLGILFKVLSAREDRTAGIGNVAVHEDYRNPITWEILPDIGAVRLYGGGLRSLPWARCSSEKCGSSRGVIVFPRHMVTDGDLGEASRLGRDGCAVAFLCPSGEELPPIGGVSLMTCPDTLEVIDRTIERRLLASRVGRS